MKITKVVCGEYMTGYITDTGKLFFYPWDYSIGKPKLFDCGLSNIVDGAGGQYNVIVLDKSGNAFLANNDKTTSQIPGTGYEKVYCAFQTYFLLKAGKIYVYGEDVLNINGKVKITTPKVLTSSKTFVTLSVSCSTGEENGNYTRITCIANDGTVWQQGYNSAMKQITVNGAVAVASMGSSAIVVLTKDDLFFIGGFKPANIGLAWNESRILSIKKQFTDKGCVWPLKQIIGNTDTLHVIDANDNMFATGDNQQGEIGAGTIYDMSKAPKPFNYSWQMEKNSYQPVIQVPGKWKEIFTGETIAFYLYAFDIYGNLFSIGRNKSQALGNGFTTDYNDQDKFPNALDMPRFSFVDPLNLKDWYVVKFNPATPIKITPAPAPTVITPDPVPEMVTKESYDKMVQEYESKVNDLSTQIDYLNGIVASKDNTIGSLNIDIKTKDSLIASLKTDIETLNSSIAGFNNIIGQALRILETYKN